MPIAQAAAETDEAQHVADYIQAAGHVGLANAEFIQAAESSQATAIVHDDIHSRFADTKAISAIPPQADGKGSFHLISQPPLNPPEDRIAVDHRRK